MPAAPSVSDAEFFSLLDYSLPYLSKVESAVKTGDYEAAKAELLAAMRSRRKPVYKINWWDRPDKLNTGYDRTVVDKICRHVFSGPAISAYPDFEMGEKIAWDADPCKDREWAWCLNRHYVWSKLGEAYWATGDEKYAREFNDELIDWVTTRPVVTDGKHNSSPSWRTIEAGIRLQNTWPTAYQRFLQSPSFTPKAHTLMMKSMIEHARHLIKNPTTGNWLVIESGGLVHLGTLFPEFKDSAEWRRISLERLETELTRQVYPDGFQYELTTHYHMGTVWNFTAALDILQKNGIQAPGDYMKNLEKLYQAAMYCLKPSGYLPGTNDSNVVIESDRGPSQTTIEKWLDNGASLFGRKDMRYVGVRGKDGVPPVETSHAFKYAGFHIMRSGWDKDARYLIFDAGPFGAGHQHEDKLMLELCAYGKTLLFDCGRDAYAGTPFRHYCLSTASHNTALIDGYGQNRRAQKPEERKWVVKKPLPLIWMSNPDFDYASGVYDEGYGPQADKTVTHRRQVLFVKPDYWMVLDTFTGEGEHQIDTLWHFRPGKVSVDRKSLACLTANANEPNLLVLPASSNGLALDVVEGTTDPVQGWISTDYNKRVKAPAAVYHWKGSIPVSFAWLLYPSPGTLDKHPHLQALDGIVDCTGTPAAYKVTLPDGSVDYILLAHGLAGTKRFGGFETEEEVAVIHIDAVGKRSGN